MARRRRADLDDLLASSGGALRRLAWLLTEDSEHATPLVGDALAAAYLAPRGTTAAERRDLARDAMVHRFTDTHGAEKVVRFGSPTSVSGRQWAAAVLVHDERLPTRTVGRLVGLTAAEVEGATSAVRADTVRAQNAPPDVGWFDPDQVVTAAQPRIARRRRRRRKALAAVLVVALALTGVGVLVNRLNRPAGAATSIELSERVADVEVAPGRTERLQVRRSGARLTLNLYGKPATAAEAIVTPPSDASSVTTGAIRGLPFYVVRGRVAAAKVVGGVQGADISRASQVVPIGGWTVVWPRQPRGRATGLLWRTVESTPRAAFLTRRPESRHRVTVPAGDVTSALAMTDDETLTLVTWTGRRSTRVRHGRAVITEERSLPYTAVGYGHITKTTASARAEPEMLRSPNESRLFVVSVPMEAFGGLPRAFQVTLHDSDKVVGHVTLSRDR